MADPSNLQVEVQEAIVRLAAVGYRISENYRSEVEGLSELVGEISALRLVPEWTGVAPRFRWQLLQHTGNASDEEYRLKALTPAGHDYNYPADQLALYCQEWDRDLVLEAEAYIQPVRETLKVLVWVNGRIKGLASTTSDMLIQAQNNIDLEPTWGDLEWARNLFPE